MTADQAAGPGAGRQAAGDSKADVEGIKRRAAAREWAQRVRGFLPDPWVLNYMTEYADAAVAAAVGEERENCAQLAALLPYSYATNPDCDRAREEHGERIASAIRTRPAPGRRAG